MSNENVRESFKMELNFTSHKVEETYQTVVLVVEFSKLLPCVCSGNEIITQLGDNQLSGLCVFYFF